MTPISNSTELTDIERDNRPDEKPAEQIVPTDHSLPSDLFPLPMTAFEKLMLDDDHANYPRIFVISMQFIGQMQQDAYEKAIREVIRRNPLLSAIVQKVRSKWHWFSADFPDDQITWGLPDRVDEYASFNLRKQPGFRVSGHTDGKISEVRLVFHHSVSDALGARRVILDWITLYACLVTPDAKISPLDRLNYDRLRRRGEFQRNELKKNEVVVPKEPLTFWQRCRIIYDFFSQQPTRLRPVPGRKLPKTGEPTRVVTHRFDRDEVKRFRDRIRGVRINLNDVAIALLLNTIARWNRAHGETGADRLYRILVPVDLREQGDELMPAANRLSFVFITRPTSLCLDFPQLLTTIRAEMDYIDEHGSKYNLLNALPIVQTVPGLIPIGAKIPLCLATAVLANVGDTVRRLRFRFPEEDGRPLIGNLQYVRAGGASPLRPKTGLAITLTISLGELAIQSQFDPQVFSQQDAEDFLKLFSEGWKNWADDSPEFR
jgi:hypothetical protein